MYIPVSPERSTNSASYSQLSEDLFVCFVGLFHIGNWNFWLVMA